MKRSPSVRIARITALILDVFLASFLMASIGSGAGMLIAAAIFYPSREMTTGWYVVMAVCAGVVLTLFYWPEIRHAHARWALRRMAR